MIYLNLFIKSVLANNVILAMFLGLCPFIGVSKKTQDAMGMGIAVVFVLTIATLTTSLLDGLALQPLFAENHNALRAVLHTISFILVIAALVQLVEMAIMKLSQPLYESLGIYLPLITTNCAVLGIALIGVREYGDATKFTTPSYVFHSTLNGLFAGCGFLVAMLLMSGVRERLETAAIPKSFKGVPIAFICAALMALAFMGFAGLKIG